MKLILQTAEELHIASENGFEIKTYQEEDIHYLYIELTDLREVEQNHKYLLDFENYTNVFQLELYQETLNNIN